MSSQAEAAKFANSEKTGSFGAGILLFFWLLATMSLWIFAFYEVPSDGPDWVRRAQVACFGSNESGLPAASGWMLLVLSPALFLVAIYTALSREVQSSLQKLYLNNVYKQLAVILAVLVVSEAIWVAYKIRRRMEAISVTENTSASLTLPDYYPRGTSLAPDFSLINQEGLELKLSSLRGKPVLLSFIFAHCRAVCPTLIKTLSTASNEFGSDNLKVLLVTLDPWRDTPASLPGLAKEWKLNSDTMILSGSAEEVSAVLDAYKVPRERDDKNGDVLHPALVQVISPEGELAYSFNNPSVNWLVVSLKRLTHDVRNPK